MTQWKMVKGYEGLYQVSNEGEVYSMGREVVCKTRWGSLRTLPIAAKTLTPSPHKSGHQYVRLYPEKGKGTGKDMAVHQLVLEAFVGPCPEGMQCCHKDGDPKNNRLDNLRWDTPKSNQADRKRHGRHHVEHGEQRYNAKLTDDKVREIRRRYSEGGVTQQELADEYGVSFCNISFVVTRRSWKHVT